MAAHRTVTAGTLIAGRNQVSEDVFVLCGGWRFWFFQLSNSRRQILDLLLPGDFFSATSVFEQRFHFSVTALTEVQISGMRRAEVQARPLSTPDILTALANSCIAQSEAADKMKAALGHLAVLRSVPFSGKHFLAVKAGYIPLPLLNALLVVVFQRNIGFPLSPSKRSHRNQAHKTRGHNLDQIRPKYINRRS